MRRLIDEIVDAFDAGDLAQLGELLSKVRSSSRSSQAETQEHNLPSDEQIGTDFKDMVMVWVTLSLCRSKLLSCS